MGLVQIRRKDGGDIRPVKQTGGGGVTILQMCSLWLGTVIV